MSDHAETLCERAGAGDLEAASELVSLYYERIFAWFRRLCGNDDDAAEHPSDDAVLRLAEVRDADGVRVRDARRGLGLAREARDDLVVAANAGCKTLTATVFSIRTCVAR